LTILGPLSIQADYTLANLSEVVLPMRSADGRIVNSPIGTRGFHGGYVAVSYFLTGEHRLYNKSMGKLNPWYTRPNTNFWFVRDENGRLSSCLGAWELTFRYSYLNLNDEFIRGGVLSGFTYGLNWHLNPNMRIMFNYVNDQRWHRDGAFSGVVQGFGIRTHFQF